MAEPNFETWWYRTQSIEELWAKQPTFIISQFIYILAGIITLIHAFTKGGRWPYFWLGTVLHGLFTDNFWALVAPQYDNFWHSHTPLMFFGGRLPLHIILLYPAFIYHAAYAVSRLNLPMYAQPFAVGLVTVLIDIPYDIVAVKFVHWTWHDTDPNIYDRHYWVPWNSYYFHATFTASFYFAFHGTRHWLAQRWNAPARELASLVVATLLGMPGGVMLFVPLYHPLHDNLGIHSEVTFFVLASIFFAIIIQGLLNSRIKAPRLEKMDYVLLAQLALHYITYWCFVVFMNPENEVSTGYHEPVGPCHETATLTTPFNQVLTKKKYFCPSDYDEKYFDFHCVRNKLPEDGSKWYTICGTPFENRNEYIFVISAILVVAASVFRGLYFKTLGTPDSAVKFSRKKLQ